MNTPSSLGAKSNEFINSLQRLASLHKFAKGPIISLLFIRPLQNDDQVRRARSEATCLFNFVFQSRKFLAEPLDEIQNFNILFSQPANRWLQHKVLDAAGNGYVKAKHCAIKSMKSLLTRWLEMIQRSGLSCRNERAKRIKGRVNSNDVLIDI